MASLHKQGNKPFWFAAFTGPDGRRKFKSTGTANKETAQLVCDGWAKAARLARQNILTPDRARTIMERTVAEIVESTGQVMPNTSTRQFLESWLREKKASAAPATVLSYKGTIQAFLEFLGNRASASLATLTATDIRNFKNRLASRVSPATVNNYLKALKVSLGQAVRLELITKNPAALVENMRGIETARRAFTMDELRKLLSVATADWQTMLLIGLYTGLRLQDCANLRWTNLDLQAKELTVRTRKTGRVQVLPVAKPLMRHLEALPVDDDPKAPLCPALCGKGSAYLSGQFHGIMEAAGMAAVRDSKKKSTGKGRNVRREFNELSFHCLRHTATSLLKNAGVSDAIAGDIIGHESEAVSRNYTHIDGEAKRAAVDKMPDVKGTI